MMSNIFMCLFAFRISLMKCLFKSSAHFLVVSFVFLLLSFRVFVHNLDTYTQIYTLRKIIFQSGLVISFSTVSFEEKKF